MSVSRLPVRRRPAAEQRFRLGTRSYALAACVCLYRNEVTEQGLAEYLVLTSDMRFAYLSRQRLTFGADMPIDLHHALTARELPAGEARDFLLAHGEGDLVDDFPDLFSIVQRAQVLVPQQGGRFATSTAH